MPNLLRKNIDTDIEDLAEQYNHLMQETKHLHKSVISKVNELFQKIQSETAAEFQLQSAQLNENKDTIIDINTRIERTLDETKTLNGRPFNAKVFLKTYTHVKVINQIVDDLSALNQSRRLVTLSFDHIHLSKEIMSDTATFVSLRKEESKAETTVINDIIFPQSVSSSLQSRQVIARPKGNQQYQQLPVPVPATANLDQSMAARQVTVSNSAVASRQPQRQSSDSKQRQDKYRPKKTNQAKGNTTIRMGVVMPIPLSQVKAKKQNSFDVKLKDDNVACSISGMTLIKYNRVLLVDNINKRVQMFSPNVKLFSLFSSDIKLLSSVSVPCEPWDIAVVNDETAVVTCNKTILKLAVSRRQLSISGTVQLDFTARGICSCKDNLIVTCPDTKPPSVKLIDQTGRVYWSVSTDQQGRQLFEAPRYVCCHEGVTSTVVMTDIMKNTLTLMKADTGEVVTHVN